MNRRQRPGPVVIACVAMAFVAGCGKDPASPPSIAPSSSTARVVSLIPSATSILLDLGAGSDLAGATRYCRLPAALADLPRVGGILDVSAEAVVALRPTLVIGSPAVLKGRLADLCSAAGARLLPLDFENLDDVRRGIADIGAAVGRQNEASRLLARFDEDLKGLRQPGNPVRVLFVVGTKPLVVASDLSFQGELLEAMGLQNVVVSSRGGFPTWSLEQVIRAAPDVIIDGIAGGEPSADLLSDAGVNASVVRMPDDAILLPSPGALGAAARLGDAVRAALRGGAGK
ncbi:MAG TPA: helical backbone metal receptor [Myxococcota bacterium]|nr:helical backbone metal receptor [Myxococcota bacterium]HOA13678.1 helical backbone metal receptor [Myxococcota bacterium]HOH76360.1 helical backbone metal receptor [Myxococcota bacterium]